MLKTVSSEEARLHWRDMLDTAAQGGTVVIERHGKPSAVVVNPAEWERLHKAHIAELQRRAQEDDTVSWEDALAGMVERGLIDSVDA